MFAPSNNASTTDIVGSGGDSAGSYTNSFGGTSAAAPYSAGAAAALQSAAKVKMGRFLSPAELTEYLVSTGQPITDSKAGITKPRVDLGAAVAALTAPDLIVESPGVTNDSPITGQVFTINAVVRNQGLENSLASTLRYYVSGTNVISSLGTQLAQEGVDALAAGATSARSADVSIATEGIVWVGACVDSVADESLVLNQCSEAVQINVMPVQYAVTPSVSPSSGGSLSCSPTVVNSGSDSTCTAVANNGYGFLNFSGDCTETAGNVCTLSNVTSAKSVTANFAVSVNGSCGRSSGGIFITAPATNLCAAGVASSVSGSGPWNWSCVGANGGITASCAAAIQTYNVSGSASPVEGGSVSCSPAIVNYGGESRCSASPNSGYSLAFFSGDCADTACVLTNITEEKQVVGNFSLNSYTFNTTAIPTAGGSVSCTPNPVNHGASAACAQTANQGYSFGGFRGSCVGMTCNIAYVMGNQYVRAYFLLPGEELPSEDEDQAANSLMLLIISAMNATKKAKEAQATPD